VEAEYGPMEKYVELIECARKGNMMNIKRKLLYL
jgi:hypothetical protein